MSLLIQNFDRKSKPFCRHILKMFWDIGESREAGGQNEIDPKLMAKKGAKASSWVLPSVPSD